MMTVKDFSEWSEKARELREKCIVNEIEREEFFQWLNNDRVYKKRS